MKDLRIGAIITYLGTVCEFSDGVGLEFKDNEQAIQRLQEIENEALNRFGIDDVAIIHRVGFLPVSEDILLVAISASHREPAFATCKCIIDDMKQLHRSWRKEVQK